MFKQAVSLALAASLLDVFALPGRADSQTEAEAEQTARVKATIGSRGVGEKATVTIEMRDGTKVKGYISEALEESFTLTDAKTRQATTIVYGDVAKVDKGRPEWAKLLIFVGATYGALIAGMAIAILAAGGV